MAREGEVKLHTLVLNGIDLLVPREDVRVVNVSTLDGECRGEHREAHMLEELPIALVRQGLIDQSSHRFRPRRPVRQPILPLFDTTYEELVQPSLAMLDRTSHVVDKTVLFSDIHC